MRDLGKITVSPKTGEECLFFDGKNVGKNLIDFWKWSVSDLLSNATRGTFAEFIVATAVGISFSKIREEWSAFDLITDTGIKIEVKSSAYLQSWNQKDYSKIVFSIKESHYWDSDSNKQSINKYRPSDVYVFCLLDHKEKSSVNPLNLNQWKFYVLNTKRINEYKRSKHSITLKSLEKLTNSIKYNELKMRIKEEFKK